MNAPSAKYLKSLRSLPDIPAIVLCAFVLTLISPACQAMGGGKLWMEICGYNGVEKVAFDVETTTDTPPADPHAYDNCALCQIKSGQYFAPEPALISDVTHFDFIYVSFHAPPGPALLFRGHNFESRGPPLV